MWFHQNVHAKKFLIPQNHEANNIIQTAGKIYQKILVQNLSPSKSYIDDHFNDVISQNSRVFQKLCMFLVRAYLGRHREFCLSPLTSDVDTETRDNSRTVPQAHRRQVKAAKDRFNLTFCSLQQDGSLNQFYSLDFSQSRTGVKKCVFIKLTIKICVSCY